MRRLDTSLFTYVCQYCHIGFVTWAKFVDHEHTHVAMRGEEGDCLCHYVD